MFVVVRDSSAADGVFQDLFHCLECKANSAHSHGRPVSIAIVGCPRPLHRPVAEHTPVAAAGIPTDIVVEDVDQVAAGENPVGTATVRTESSVKLERRMN